MVIRNTFLVITTFHVNISTKLGWGKKYQMLVKDKQTSSTKVHETKMKSGMLYFNNLAELLLLVLSSLPRSPSLCVYNMWTLQVNSSSTYLFTHILQKNMYMNQRSNCDYTLETIFNPVRLTLVFATLLKLLPHTKSIWVV